MSLTLLSDKLDKLNEKEKLIRLTYDVRGTNKHQHRFIADLKQDFKEDLELRYGNKPYGLGWNQETEIETEREAENQEEDQQEEIIEDDEDIEKENGDIMTSAFSPNNNFRPVSGKISAFGAQNRPFSASTIRPMTASSNGGNSNTQKFMFPQGRPISAVSGIKKQFGGMTQEISDSYMFGAKSPQSMQQALSPEDLVRMQASNVNSNSSAKLRANESIFWKNTKKFDIAQSSKQFYTKQLVFDVPHADPKLISSADLEFLRGAKIHNTLESSKLTAPKNHTFEDVAKSKRSDSKGKNLTTGGELLDGESQLDAKSMFNQSLSYIHSLRNESKVNTTNLLKEQDSTNKVKKHQRPVTAHPFISSSISPSKAPLETVKEHVPENSRIYFSSLSDLRKKAFFLKLHSLEPAAASHPSLTKELKFIDWECFKDLPNQPDFQSLHLLMLDLNSFDHVRYELEFTKTGRVQAKDKEDLREVLDVYNDFLKATKTNIASIIIYYESANNCMLELFSRVLVYEKQENEYDLIVWRNIYRYILYKIILANAPLYPDCKTYQDFSRMIKDIIEDKKDYVSPVSPQIQQTKDHPIVVERNSHVYNFDFHSYILECSSFYAQSLHNDTSHPKPPVSRKDSKTIDNRKTRPYSAVASNSKFSAFRSPQNQKSKDNTLRESSNMIEPSFFGSPQRLHTPAPTMPNSTQSASRDRLAATLSHVIQGNSPPVLSAKRGSGGKINPMDSLRQSHEKVDFSVCGGRMEIYPDMWAASNTVKTNWRGAGMISMQFSQDYKRFSSSAMQTPKGFEGMFMQDANGITMKQNVNSMKKSNTTVVVQRRPYSAQKKPIKPHVVGGNLPISMFLSGASSSRNKF